jgi:hypothetical protein
MHQTIYKAIVAIGESLPSDDTPSIPYLVCAVAVSFRHPAASSRHAPEPRLTPSNQNKGN